MIRCFNCFKEYDESLGSCPFCGEAERQARQPIDLAPGTDLMGGRYILGRSIGSGGFGIIYRAWDSNLEIVVAIKEYYPSRIVSRATGTRELKVRKKAKEEFDYRKKRFLDEARNLAKFSSHNSIPNIFEYFEENNSAYIVMEFLEGESLRGYLKKNERIEPEFAIHVATEVGHALSALHKEGIIHRDVAPDNIFICSDKSLRIKLLDFGAARLADNDDDAVDIILKPGYSPIEQYDIGGLESLDERSDLYSLAATLYVMLTGIKPDEATNRKIEDKVVPPHEINPELLENLSNAIMKAMAVDRHMRYKNVDDFIAAIRGEIRAVPLSVEKRQKKTKRIIGIVAALLLVLTGIVTLIVYSNSLRLKNRLNPATITVWYSSDSESEDEAMRLIANDFESKYEGVVVDLSAISPDEYEKKLLKAAKNDQLPNLFESTGLSDDVLDSCRDVSTVLESYDVKKCAGLSQYDDYYYSRKQIPLAIDIPMVCVLINEYDYSENSFRSIDDLRSDDFDFAVFDNDTELWDSVFDSSDSASVFYYFDETDDRSALLFVSSSDISEIDKKITPPHKYLYYDADNIPCRFTYEWSLGNGTAAQRRAADRLLSMMLSNDYQSLLLYSVDALPICKQALEAKVDSISSYDKGIKKTVKNFSFATED